MRKGRAGEDWTGGSAPTDVMLTPGGVLSALSDRDRHAARRRAALVDLRAFVFRHEPSTDPARMQIFRQREYVRLGTPEQALAHRDYWLERGERLLRALGLDVQARRRQRSRSSAAAGALMAATQREQTLKFELVVPIARTEKPTAIASCNYHLDHFGQAFGIRTPTAQPAHTACIGFGLERIALALFKTHGLDAVGLAGVRARSARRCDAAGRRDLDPATYRRHAVHGDGRIWAETNCYVDIWIELLHALGPRAGGRAAVHARDRLRGRSVDVLQVSAAAICSSCTASTCRNSPSGGPLVGAHRGAGRAGPAGARRARLVLPARHGGHRRTARPREVDRRRDGDRSRACGSSATFTARAITSSRATTSPPRSACDDADPARLPPYVEFVKTHDAPSPDAARRDLGRSAAAPPARGAARQPVRSLRAAVRARPRRRSSPRTSSSSISTSFATLRQFGACFELSATYLRWLAAQGETGLEDAAAAFRTISESREAISIPAGASRRASVAARSVPARPDGRSLAARHAGVAGALSMIVAPDIALDRGWSLASAAPNRVRTPADFDDAALTWLPAIVPGTAAQSLQALQQFDFDHPRDFDADDWWYRCAFSHDADPRRDRDAAPLRGPGDARRRLAQRRAGLARRQHVSHVRRRRRHPRRARQRAGHRISIARRRACDAPAAAAVENAPRAGSSSSAGSARRCSAAFRAGRRRSRPWARGGAWRSTHCGRVTSSMSTSTRGSAATRASRTSRAAS